MRGREGVNKIFFVVEVSQGKAARAIHQDMSVCHADAGTRRQQPIAVDRLGNREACCGATGINPCGGKVIAHMHRAEIGLDSQDPMAGLKVIACLAASSEAPRTQWLMTNSRNRRHTALGEIAGWAENGTGERIGITLDSSGIAADVKALPVLSKTRGGKDKNHRAAFQ